MVEVLGTALVGIWWLGFWDFGLGLWFCLGYWDFASWDIGTLVVGILGLGWDRVSVGILGIGI